MSSRRYVAHHRIDQLDAIVLGGIMAGSDHDTNPLAAELLRTQSCKQAHAKHDGVEEVAERAVSVNPTLEDDRGVCVEAG